jgi:hypothetical protein
MAGSRSDALSAGPSNTDCWHRRTRPGVTHEGEIARACEPVRRSRYAVANVVDEIGPDISRLLEGSTVDIEQWRDATAEYFARTPQPNTLFNILAHNWMARVVLPVQARDLFQTTVRMLEDWESRPGGEPRHKGTPYYWLGMAYTLLGDIDQGFLYMHVALEEDRRTSGDRTPQMPAFAFVSLDAQSDQQAFKAAVDTYAAFLEERMARYRTDSGGTLTLPALRAKVAPVEARWDGMFHLVYATARIHRLEQMGHVASASPFGCNLLAQAIGDLCIVADEWMGELWPALRTFHPRAVRFLHDERRVSDAQSVMEQVKASSDLDWGGCVAALLDGTFGFRRSLSSVEIDIATAYLMRNSAAHSVTANRLIGSRFRDIEQRTYSAVFAIAESLT